MPSRSWASLFILGVLVLGCSDGPTREIEPPDPDPYMKQTSITNCLFNLKLAYNQRNVAKFSNLFDDGYTFVFAPRDLGGEQNIPLSWGKPDEILSATNLLDSLQNVGGFVCESIGLNFISGTPVPNVEFPMWKDVTLSQIQLLVDSRHQTTGVPLLYEVIGDQATLSFNQTDETDPTSGLKIWKIIQWIDKPVNHKTGASSTTWGWIKAIWH